MVDVICRSGRGKWIPRNIEDSDFWSKFVGGDKFRRFLDGFLLESLHHALFAGDYLSRHNVLYVGIANDENVDGLVLDVCFITGTFLNSSVPLRT